jgi:membrane associated rhomboid family serine protease
MIIGLYVVDTVQFFALFAGASEYVQSIIPLTPIKTYLMFQDFPIDRELYFLLLDQKAASSLSELSGKTQSLVQAILDQNRDKGFLTISLHDLSILKGQIYRLITPALLHANLIHILFNLLWLFPLSLMIEKRAKSFKLLLIMLTVAMITNVAQFIASGPLFLGISGVVCGLAGFVFIRSKKAPWEGYPVTRSGILLLLFYILFLSLIEILGKVIHYYGASVAVIPIANTAHIVGALIGGFLGWNRWFRCTS